MLPGSGALMFLLPLELRVKIIEHAAYRCKTDDYHHTYLALELLNLCLVSRKFYGLAAPLLYRDIVIQTGWDVENLVPIFVPLLSREQRRRLRESAPTKHDAFTDQDSMVDPLWVRKYVLLQGASAFNSVEQAVIAASQPPFKSDQEQEFLWRCIEESVQNATNLQFFCWEPEHRSPCLAETLSRLRRLSHLTCGNTDYLCPQGLEPRLAPLRSLSVYWKGIGYEVPSPQSLRIILQASSNSLRTLNLSFARLKPSDIDTTVEEIFKDDTSLECHNGADHGQLPNLQELLINGYNCKTIRKLTQVIDFSRLRSLQLSKPGKNEILVGELGQQTLTSLRRVSLSLVPSAVVQTLNMCSRLQEIYVVYEDDDPRMSSNTTQAVLEAVIKHGETLTVLMFGGIRCPYAPITTAEFASLVDGCPNLEELRMYPGPLDWNFIVLEIPKLLSLRHLYITQIQLPSPAVGGEPALTWESSSADSRPSVFNMDLSGGLDGLNTAIEQLLTASVKYGAFLHTIQDPLHSGDFAWRDHSKLRSVTIGAYKTFAGYNRPSLFTRGYLLSDRTRMVWEGLDEPYHTYSYRAHGVSISVGIVNSMPDFAHSRLQRPSVPVCGYHTSFKIASPAVRDPFSYYS